MLLLATYAFATPVHLAITLYGRPTFELQVDAPAAHGEFILALPVGDDLVWLDLMAVMEGEQLVVEPWLTAADPRRSVPLRKVIARPRITTTPEQGGELSTGQYKIEILPN